MPSIEEAFLKRKKKVGDSWRMDETYLKVESKWAYYYRAVDTKSRTIDYFLSRKRDHKAVYAFLEKAIKNNGVPRLINIDSNPASKLGIQKYNEINGTNIKIRQNKYLNAPIECSHARIKKIIRNNRSGFKSFESAQIMLSGIEVIRMIKKDQLKNPKQTNYLSFCSLFE